MACVGFLHAGGFHAHCSVSTTPSLRSGLYPIAGFISFLLATDCPRWLAKVFPNLASRLFENVDRSVLFHCLGCELIAVCLHAQGI
ncbi:hypothetical protein ACP4OV_007714 [Aristida adscensionis]